ncbi:MAG TPA: oxidoreductase [Chloroflexota bacterium]
MRGRVYVDSVTLLQVSAEVLGLAGVEDAALVMATELNRDLLLESGLLVGEAERAGANDLVISVRAESEAAARAALAHAEALLVGRRAPDAEPSAQRPRSLRSAHRADPEASLAVISVPGPFAAGEARLALADGMHVFLFSDNVALEDEVDLKCTARERGLLVMGPDCGTAILNGVGLGFANVVRRGSIGVVGASGTGIQEVVSLVHQAGRGISHAIGTGSRDLHAAVGGITTLAAIALLAEDPQTETIVLVSKPSDPSVARTVLRALADTGKRSVVYLQSVDVEVPRGVVHAGDLEEAARLALGESPREKSSRASPERQVRGLFCGGTLREEAAAVLGAGHVLEDLGDDQYTRGRAHPIIDPTLRNQAIVQAGHDQHVGVLLLDFILGLGAHPDPAGAALPAIQQAISAARSDSRDLSVVAHVVGTDLDPQGLARQEAALRSAGVRVYGSNYAAAVAVCAA